MLEYIGLLILYQINLSVHVGLLILSSQHIGTYWIANIISNQHIGTYWIANIMVYYYGIHYVYTLWDTIMVSQNVM